MISVSVLLSDHLQVLYVMELYSVRVVKMRTCAVSQVCMYFVSL